MHVINVENVNQALADGLRYLSEYGEREDSRNGSVIVAPGPVTTVYRKPLDNVLFSPMRDANPFFHLMEALWILAGHNDLAFPLQFNSNFASFSDDGKTVRGSAYGYRARHWFGYDQLAVIAEELQRDPKSRRCVLTLWDAIETVPSVEHGHIAHYAAEQYKRDEAAGNPPSFDLGDLLADTKDKPCNTHVYFDVRRGALNMTVCNRSNDILWGAYGANAVHFSFLQEYLAAAVGVPAGFYWQMSNNYHVYEAQLKRYGDSLALAQDCDNTDLYPDFRRTTPLVSIPERFNQELGRLLEDPGRPELQEPFLRNVAQPIYLAWLARKGGYYDRMYQCLEEITGAEDWKHVCLAWVLRRKGSQ